MSLLSFPKLVYPFGCRKCRKDKREKELNAPTDHVDEADGDNPGYHHTPKSSIFDLSTGSIPPHHLSFSSMLGLNKDLQPIEAPITGLGSLAAHTEPYHPGMGGNRYSPQGFPPYVTQEPIQNGTPSQTPPQPNRPAPSLSGSQQGPYMGPQGPHEGPQGYPGQVGPQGYPGGPPKGPGQSGWPEDAAPYPGGPGAPGGPGGPGKQHFPGGPQERGPAPAPQRPGKQGSPRGPQERGSAPTPQEPLKQGGPRGPQGPGREPVWRDDPRGPFVPAGPTGPSGQHGPGGPQGPFVQGPQEVPGGPEQYPSDVPIIPIIKPQTVPSTRSEPPAQTKPRSTKPPADSHKYPRQPPHPSSPFHFPSMLPPEKASAFNVSADDLPYIDDTEDEDVVYHRPRPLPHRSNVSNV